MIFCCMSGVAMMLFISSCSLFTISRGVSWRAKITCQDTASSSGIPTASPIGGTSGNVGKRVAEVTASARNFPSLISGSYAPASATDATTCPAATSAIDCGLFRYGTWAMSNPNFCFSNSAVKWGAPPMPEEL